MTIVDPHVHVWTQDPAYPWAPETTEPPTGEATPEMLLKEMAAHGVDRTVLVQVIYYRWDNRYTAHALRAYPDKFMAVCRVNPEDPAAPDHLSYWTEEHGFHGVRLSPAVGASGDWFAGPLMDPLFQRAAELGVPMLILTRPPRLPDLAALLERHPDLDVVVDHMADVTLDDAGASVRCSIWPGTLGCTSRSATRGRYPGKSIPGATRKSLSSAYTRPTAQSA